MKKIFLILTTLFVLSCTTNSREIKQTISYDNVNNTYSITTRFDRPDTYWAHVYCKTNADSVKNAEYIKADSIQKLMDKKINE